MEATIAGTPATVKSDSGEDKDRLVHMVHRCGVEPVLTRCGARPRNTLPPGSLPPATSLFCEVCADLVKQPCERCKQ